MRLRILISIAKWASIQDDVQTIYILSPPKFIMWVLLCRIFNLKTDQSFQGLHTNNKPTISHGNSHTRAVTSRGFFFGWPSQGGWDLSESPHTYRKTTYSSGKGAHIHGKKAQISGKEACKCGKSGVSRIWTLGSYVRTVTPYHSDNEPFSIGDFLISVLEIKVLNKVSESPTRVLQKGGAWFLIPRVRNKGVLNGSGQWSRLDVNTQPTYGSIRQKFWASG